MSFSTLEFLKRLQKKKARRIQLKQIILLIIRTLAIIALVFVFARPALQTNQAAGSAASVEIILIIDNCLNTMTETRNGQLFRLVTNRAHDIIELIESDDQITLIPLSHPNRCLTVGSGQLDLIRDRLDNMEPTFLSPLFIDTKAQTDSILVNTSRFNREVYFCSSFYSPQWDSVQWSEPSETERRFLLPAGPENNSNLSISSVSISSAILQRGRPIEINASLNNHSGKAVQNALVSVYLEGERIAQSSITIPADGTVIQTFTIVPEHSGLLACSVKLEDIDPFAPDDRKWFVLDVPDSIRVLAVVPNEGVRTLLHAAFSGKEADFVNITWSNLKQWETRSLAGFNLLLLAGVPSVSAGASERVAEFAKQGGGVIIFQHTDADLAGLSRRLWHKLGFAGARGVTEGSNTIWGKIDLGHPLFSGVFDDDGNPRSPDFQFAIDLALGKDDQVIIPFSNGKPFLIERQAGNGIILMYTVPIGPETGNFIYTGIFAPLLLRSVGYAASCSGNADQEWQTGRSYRVILPLANVQTIQMTLPNGDKIELPPRPVVGGVEYDIGQIDLPGIYDFRIKDRISARYIANIPTDQSDLVRRELNEIIERLGGASIIKPAESDIEEHIYSARFGRELWQPIALIFILLLLAESVLGRSWKKRQLTHSGEQLLKE